MAPRPRDLRERFFEKVAPPNENGCTLWNGTRLKSGYGQIEVAGKALLAHRVSVQLSGREIPQGYHVDHLCRVPSCVNPAHLEPVTPRENNIRGKTFAAANLAKTHCPQGHELSGDNLDTYGLSKGKRVCRSCMQRRCREWHWKNREARLIKMREYKAARL